MSKTDMSCNVEFAPGEAIEVEFGQGQNAWVTLGAAVSGGDFWFSGQSGIPDIRVRVLRLENELRIVVDRGGQGGDWWPTGGAPMLRLLFEPSSGRVAATAGAGLGAEFQEVQLGAARI